MTWGRAAVAGALLAVLGAASIAALNRRDRADGNAPAISGAPVSAGQRARGEYLTRAADCIVCHTVPDSHRPFAGGVGFKLPIGTLYSTNITADRDRGIGAWSDDEFVRAVREGVGKDGRHLYPAFPYTSYAALSRSDVLAIKSYLMSLPPIGQANRANRLAFPFDQRWGLVLWKAFFFRSHRFVVDPSRSGAWNRGAYLATALGHCAECHTPRNAAFGLDHAREFSGEELQGWRAYNITSDVRYGIGGWAAADLARYLHSGEAQGKALAVGPMGEAVAHSLQFLNADDLAALVEFVRAIPANAGSQRIDVGSAQIREERASDTVGLGARLFDGACASCHLGDGTGAQTDRAALRGTRTLNDTSAANVIQTILGGVNLRFGAASVYMPAFGATYSDTEIAALANYVVDRFGAKTSRVTPAEVSWRRSP